MFHGTQSDRREFLQVSAGALAATSVASSQAFGQDEAKPKAGDAVEPKKEAPLPRRKLGKTGVEVTILNQGVGARDSSNERIIRAAYASGVRMFDTAKVYRTEPHFKRWFEQTPEVRKDIFLVSKDEPREPGQMAKMLDERLETIGTDYLDLFFVHGLGDHHGAEDAIKFITGKKFRDTVEAIKKSGKAKFIGFSTHHKDRAAIIQAAAEAGTVDAIMLQYTPWLEKDSPLNKALDVAWQKGVGLISMKQIASNLFGDRPKFNVLEEVKKRVPTLAEKKLSPFQGLLHAIWTDERINAVCVSMRNTTQILDNADAARRYEPLKTTEILQLRDTVIAHGPMLCADCDGRCSKAAGTQAELGNIARFVTYHQCLGDRALARENYAKLAPELRDWSNADLDAAQKACPNQLDFAQILALAETHLA